MFAFSREQFADLCAICYFDVQEYHQGMSFDDFVTCSLNEKRSSDAIYEQLRSYCKQLDVSCFTHLKLVHYVNENNQNGLVFYHFEDDEHCYLVYRGSESLDGENRACGWEDWEDNLEIFLGVTHQQLRAVKYLNELCTNKPITMLGHSKGGNLALFLSVVCSQERLKQLDHVITFNAPGLNLDTMIHYEQRIHDEELLSKITCYENEADPVSSMFHHVKSPIVLKTSGLQKGIRGAYHSHQLWAFEKEKGCFIEVEHKSILASITEVLTEMMENLEEGKKKKVIDHFMEYVRSDMPLEEMYHVLLYHIGLRHQIFEEGEDLSSIELETLLDRIHEDVIKQVSSFPETMKKVVEEKVESWLNKDE